MFFILSFDFFSFCTKNQKNRQTKNQTKIFFVVLEDSRMVVGMRPLMVQAIPYKVGLQHLGKIHGEKFMLVQVLDICIKLRILLQHPNISVCDKNDDKGQQSFLPSTSTPTATPITLSTLRRGKSPSF